jgi:hypothetical protein
MSVSEQLKPWKPWSHLHLPETHTPWLLQSTALLHVFATPEHQFGLPLAGSKQHPFALHSSAVMPENPQSVSCVQLLSFSTRSQKGAMSGSSSSCADATQKYMQMISAKRHITDWWTGRRDLDFTGFFCLLRHSEVMGILVKRTAGSRLCACGPRAVLCGVCHLGKKHDFSTPPSGR